MKISSLKEFIDINYRFRESETLLLTLQSIANEIIRVIEYILELRKSTIVDIYINGYPIIPLFRFFFNWEAFFNEIKQTTNSRFTYLSIDFQGKWLISLSSFK